MPQRALLLFLVLGVSLASYSQAVYNTDSLARAIAKLPDDSEKVNQLNRLAGMLRDRDCHKSLAYAMQAHNLSKTLQFDQGRLYALENMAWAYFRKGEYAQAFELSAEGLKLAETLGDQRMVIRCLNTIATINVEQRQYRQAVLNFRQAIRLSRESKDLSSEVRSVSNLAVCYLEANRLDSANYYALDAIRLSRNARTGYYRGLAHRVLGDVNEARINYERALFHYDSAMAVAIRLNNSYLRVSTQYRIGQIHLNLGYYREALSDIHAILADARHYGFRADLERAYQLLADTYEAQNDYAKAHHYQRLYIGIHDSLQEQRNNERMAIMQARFESEIKESKIELLTKDTQLKQKEINSQRLWKWWSVGGLALMVVLAFMLWYSNGLKRKTNIELANKNAEIAMQAQALHSLNLTKDKLFSIISHDLRSPLASLSGLIAVLGMGAMTHEEFSLMSHKISKNLDRVQGDLENLLMWAQSQLNGLNLDPTMIELRAVIDEKVQLFSEIARQKAITIENEVSESHCAVADRNHISLVMRNLLANAIKFNRIGGIIKVTADRKNEFIEVSVTDTGIGMTEEDVARLFNAQTHFTNPGTNQEKGAGIGLLLTKEFVEKNGGTIWVESKYEIGTKFTFTVRADNRNNVPVTIGISSESLVVSP